MRQRTAYDNRNVVPPTPTAEGDLVEIAPSDRYLYAGGEGDGVWEVLHIAASGDRLLGRPGKGWADGSIDVPPWRKLNVVGRAS
jgi:hypothetical protein